MIYIVGIPNCSFKVSARYLIVSNIIKNLVLLGEVIYFDNPILNLALFQTNYSSLNSTSYDFRIYH